MGEKTKEYDLEDRLINFAVLMIDVVWKLDIENSTLDIICPVSVIP
ncbi:MAG: hypothetical protein U9N83_08095 [Thermodesulfobacteriota bacterium]|nr:hypothetical protein [Thermodesulfobacteriota bacterium]